MKKILIIDKLKLGDKEVLLGGDIISNRNYKFFKEIYGESLDIFIIKDYKNKYETLLNSILNYSFGLTKKQEKKILNRIKEEKYEIIFLGSSLLGRIGEKIKKLNKRIKIISFFHNVEIEFGKEFIKNKNYLYKFILNSSIFNEKLATKYSDYLISLNERDALKIFDIYEREIDFIFPTTFTDAYDEKKINKEKNKENTILFVGSNFFGNIEGLDWFIKNCMTKINARLIVIGKGMEILREKYRKYSNVEVLGTVENIDKFYYETDIVVLPIISGSGMKTKTAEALMFGKYIFGTKESFEGYSLDFKKVGGLCKTSEDFIEKINNHFNKKINEKKNEYSRNVFIKSYETQVVKKKLENFLNLFDLL